MRGTLITGMLFITSVLSGQSSDWTGSDIGVPSTSTVWSNLQSGQAVQATTFSKGIAASSNNDEISFAHTLLPVTGKITWTQPDLVSATNARTAGLMIRQTLSPDAAMVFWGLVADNTGTPKLTLSWRPISGAALKTWTFSDASLRTTGGELKLYMERRSEYVILGHYASSSNSWVPLYAVELGTKQVAHAGVSFASGSTATSWTTPSVLRDFISEGKVTVWTNVAEPYLTNDSHRPTTLGADSDVYPTASAWNTATNCPTFSNQDHVYTSITSSSSATVVIGNIKGDASTNPADVFVRWGHILGGIPVSVEGKIWIEYDVVVSKNFNQADYQGLWTYIGNVAFDSGAVYYSLDSVSGSEGEFSIDSFLSLGSNFHPDSNEDGIPDSWHAEYNFSATHDSDGDGLSNLEEFQQGTNPLSFDEGIYAVRPKIEAIGSTNRKAPKGLILADPLQVKVTYGDTTHPVYGYRLQAGQSYYQGVEVAYSNDSLNTELQLSLLSDQSGIATFYIYVTPDISSGSKSLDVRPENIYGTGENFTISPYLNTPPGPIDLIGNATTMASMRHVPFNGKNVVASGAWLASSSAEITGPTANSVQLFKWNPDGGQWRPSHQIKASGDPAGYGDKICMNGNMLAVYASGNQTVYLYERQDNSDFWKEVKQYILPDELSDFAVSKDTLLMGVGNLDRVIYLKKNVHPILWSFASVITIQAHPTEAADLVFGKSVGFSLNSEKFWIAAPPTPSAASSVSGSVRVYEKENNNWILEGVINGIVDDEDIQFGYAASLDGDVLAVGAPVRDDVTNPTVFGNVVIYRRSGSSWTRTSTTTGSTRDFGSKVHLTANQVLVPYQQPGATPPPSQTFDRVAVYELQTAGTLSQTQTMHHAGRSASMDGTSFFVIDESPTPSSQGITEFERVTEVPYDALVNHLVGRFNFNDADADRTHVALIQQLNLWSIGGVNEDELRVAASLLPHVDSLQWIGVNIRELTGLTYQETLPIKIKGISPEDPTNLSATAIGFKAIELNWLSTDTTIEQFHIERAPLTTNTIPTGGETYTVVATEAGSSRYFVDKSAVDFQDYAYRIRSENKQGFSAYSNVAYINWDEDNDGIADWWETAYGGDLDPNGNLDGDALTNLQEYQKNSNPFLNDTDGDGNSDSEGHPLNSLLNEGQLRIFTPLSKL